MRHYIYFAFYSHAWVRDVSQDADVQTSSLPFSVYMYVCTSCSVCLLSLRRDKWLFFFLLLLSFVFFLIYDTLWTRRMGMRVGTLQLAAVASAANGVRSILVRTFYDG